MQAVFGFVEHEGIGASENLVGHFHFREAVFFLYRFGNFCVRVVEGRQAVEKNRIRIAGAVHQFLIYLVGLEQTDTFVHLVFFTHRDPDIRVDGVRAFDAADVVRQCDRSAGFLRELSHIVDELFVRPQLLRREGCEMHPELRADNHQAVAHIVSSVAREDELTAFDIAEMLADSHRVRKHLGRMVIVGQSVPDRNAGLVGQHFDCVLCVAAEFDPVVEAAEHQCGIFDRFFLAHLRIAQERHVRSLVVSGDFERAARPGRRLFEQQDDVFSLQQIVSDPLLLVGFKLVRQVKQVQDFFGRIVEQRQKAASSQVSHISSRLNNIELLC